MVDRHMDYSVKGHLALVTGSSRGIGSAIALELARGGADVIVHCSHPSEQAEDIAARIRAMGRSSTVIAADLTQEEMTLSIDRFRYWSVSVAGIYLPSPEDGEMLTYAMQEVERNKEFI